MDLKRLEYFCSVAARGSISKAAKELHISQPPLSARIKELAEELGLSQKAVNKRRHKILGKLKKFLEKF